MSQVGSADGDLGARVEAAADVAEHQAGLADALFAFFCVFFWGVVEVGKRVSNGVFDICLSRWFGLARREIDR